MKLVVAPEREPLYAGIDARFDRMVEAGALDEVAALMALDLDPALPAMRAHGVRETRRPSRWHHEPGSGRHQGQDRDQALRQAADDLDEALHGGLGVGAGRATAAVAAGRPLTP